ncbi:MAG: FAD-binding protein [Alphaproteobacteria bacterium]
MPSATTFDLIVIGGGIAGLVGANRAAEAGLCVAVLEKGTAEKYPCNTRFTGGAFHVAYRDVMTDADALLASIRSLTAERFAPERAGPVATDGRRAYAWLQTEGMRFVKGGVPEYLHRVFAPPRRQRAGQDWEGRGGDVLLRTLEANLKKRGGAIHRGHRARALIMADGRCIGVRAETGGGTVELGARAVLIADGGFQGNPDLLVRYNTVKAPARIQQRGPAPDVVTDCAWPRPPVPR